MSAPAIQPTTGQACALRDPAAMVLRAEIQALMLVQARADQLEEFHRSAMINAQLEAMKTGAIIERLRDALRLIEYAAMG